LKFWNRKVPREEAQEVASDAPVGGLGVRSAIEEHLLGTHANFSDLELVACYEPRSEEAPGLMVFTRFRLPPSRGGRGVAVFYFLPQRFDVNMFNTITSATVTEDPMPPEAEEVVPTEEPVKTILGMRVAVTSEPDGS